MSMHKSLRLKGMHTRTRNVLTREERLERLAEEDRWSEDESVFGLPKVKVERLQLRKRGGKEEEEEEAPEEAALEEGVLPEEAAEQGGEQA